MGRYVLKFDLIDRGAARASFVVLSCDFSPQGAWEEIGHLQIGQSQSDVSFSPTGIWQGRNLIPISVFVSDRERAKSLLKSGTDSAGWIYAIFKRAQILRKE